MRMNIYSIFDSATGAYMRPWFVQSDEAAIRAFGDIACDNDHEVGRHPKDYTLYRVGYWDDNKGKITGETPEPLHTALEIRAARTKMDQQKTLDLGDNHA